MHQLTKKTDSEKGNRYSNDTRHHPHGVITDVDRTVTNTSLYNRQHRILQNCVHDEFQLSQAIENASNFLLTFIDICVQYITMNASTIDSQTQSHGIPILNKTLEFHCIMNATNTTDEKCVFDAQQLSRHFYISNSNVSFHGIEFRNGTTDPWPFVFESKNISGGSLFIELSTIFTIDCNFKQNSAGRGGAIDLTQSYHHMTRCHFVQNYAINTDPYSLGGAIQLRYSNIYLIGGNSPFNATIMEDNRASEGGVMFAVGSNITMMEGYFIIRNNHAQVRHFLFHQLHVVVQLHQSILYLHRLPKIK
jgi:hypothetical protein